MKMRAIQPAAECATSVIGDAGASSRAEATAAAMRSRTGVTGRPPRVRAHVRVVTGTVRTRADGRAAWSVASRGR